MPPHIQLLCDLLKLEINALLFEQVTDISSHLKTKLDDMSFVGQFLPSLDSDFDYVLTDSSSSGKTTFELIARFNSSDSFYHIPISITYE